MPTAPVRRDEITWCYNLVDESGKRGVSGMDLSLVLACYNEEPWLENSVREILAVLDSGGMEYEVIFVDDASGDRTREIIGRIIGGNPRIRMRAIYHESNTGRGRAVADGMRGSTGTVTGFIDVDLEVHPRYILDCYRAIRQGAQIAEGARVFKFIPGGILRRIMSLGYAGLVRFLLPGGGGLDTYSGCKLFLREAVLPVLDTVKDPGWFWATEIMVRSRLKGLAIAEVPCLYIRNSAKPSSVRVIKDSADSLVKLFRFSRELRQAGRAGGR